MKAEKPQRRVLIVSSSDKVFEGLYDMFSPPRFCEVIRAKNAGEAKRLIVNTPIEIMVINTPLSDEFGTDLALKATELPMGILLLVKSEMYEGVADRVEDSGVFTLQKPIQKQLLNTAVRMLCAMQSRISAMEKKTVSLKEKMEDIRTINRAKWLLIENLNMTESEAHYYIEKQAMDARIPRREIATGIIRTYDN